MVVLDPMVAKINTVVPNLVFDMNCLTKAKNAGKNVTKLVEIALGAATWAPAANWEGKGKWKMENGSTGSNGCQNKHCCTKSGLRHELLNQGKTCWEECNEIGGNCTWCGDLGSCCRIGYNDGNGCTGSNGCQNRH